MILNQAIAFVKAVELKSISAAARDLRVTSAAASFRIIQLEAHLGVQLLERTTHSLTLTEAGALFYAHALEITESLDRARDSLSTLNAEPRGVLRVTAPLGFGRRRLASLISEFHARHPKVEIRLRLSDRLFNLLDEDVDIAVRMAPLTDSSFIVRKITDCPKVLCAAPAYLKRHGRPASLTDLADHSCLVLRCANTSQAPWNFATREGRVSIPVSGRFEADDGDVLTRWALDGSGIAMKPYWEVAEHLACGELVPVLPEFRPEPAVLALLYPHRATATSKLKAFADFMVSKGGGIWRDPSEDIPLAKVA